ncbi:MAG: L,D-transpeptidase, partial [Desulfobaccales bacterium]
VLCVFFVLVLGVGGCGKKRIQPVVAKPPVPEIKAPLTAEQQEIKQLLEKNGRAYGKPTVLVVKKMDRKLTIYQGVKPVKTYPVVLGGNPRPDKVCQGDLCTPEGVYRVVTKYPHPRWDKFILLDYPNTQNWLKFSEAKKTGKLHEEAKIGGDIGIHGTHDPSMNYRRLDWTLGCVSLHNDDIDEIYPMVDSNTLVLIKKR